MTSLSPEVRRRPWERGCLVVQQGFVTVTYVAQSSRLETYTLMHWIASPRT